MAYLDLMIHFSLHLKTPAEVAPKNLSTFMFQSFLSEHRPSYRIHLLQYVVRSESVNDCLTTTLHLEDNKWDLCHRYMKLLDYGRTLMLRIIVAFDDSSGRRRSIPMNDNEPSLGAPLYTGWRPINVSHGGELCPKVNKAGSP